MVKKKPTVQETVPVEDPKPKMEYLQKQLAKARSDTHQIVSNDIDALIDSKIIGIKETFISGERKIGSKLQTGSSSLHPYEEELIKLKADLKQKEVADRLLALSQKEGALSPKELAERMELLKAKKKMRLSKSMADLEAEFEDTVGIGSARRVKNLVSLTGNIKEDMEERRMLEQKASNFAQQKEAERKQLIKKRKELMKRIQEKEEHRKQKELEREKQDQELRHQKALEKYEQSMKKIEEHAKERQENAKPAKLDREYMHNKLEKLYHETIELPTLEQKKKELEKIRNFYRPIKREDLDQHEKQFLQKLKSKESELKLKREIEAKQQGIGTYDPKKYKTKFLDGFQNQIKQDKMLSDAEKESIKRKAEKMNSYAKLVKQMHWPQVSPKKREELSKIRHSIEMSGKPLKTPKSKAGVYTDIENEKPWRNHRHTKSQGKIDWKKFVNPMLPKEPVKKEPKVVDYLLEIRKKRGTDKIEDEEYGINRSPYYDWKALIESNPDLVKIKAVETKAEMKQQHARARDDEEEENEAIQMMIGTLEAKLALLGKN